MFLQVRRRYIVSNSGSLVAWIKSLGAACIIKIKYFHKDKMEFRYGVWGKLCICLHHLFFCFIYFHTHVREHLQNEVTPWAKCPSIMCVNHYRERASSFCSGQHSWLPSFFRLFLLSICMLLLFFECESVWHFPLLVWIIGIAVYKSTSPWLPGTTHFFFEAFLWLFQASLSCQRMKNTSLKVNICPDQVQVFPEKLFLRSFCIRSVIPSSPTNNYEIENVY